MNGFTAYQVNSIVTQTPSRLVVMLYEGAIKFLRIAITKLEQNDFPAKGYYIGKAQDIISELNAVLNMQAGGDISNNLRQLYIFMSTHLGEANAKKDPQMIREVISLLEELNHGWKTIAD